MSDRAKPIPKCYQRSTTKSVIYQVVGFYSERCECTCAGHLPQVGRGKNDIVKSTFQVYNSIKDHHPSCLLAAKVINLVHRTYMYAKRCNDCLGME